MRGGEEGREYEQRVGWWGVVVGRGGWMSEPGPLFFVLFLVAVGFGWVTSNVASKKDQPEHWGEFWAPAWFFVGFFLGPIGLLIAMSLADKGPRPR